MNTKIPELPFVPTLLEARAYLIWLGFSPWCYHIDDCPSDIEWNEDLVGREIHPIDIGTLLNNHDRMQKLFIAKYGDMAWGYIWALFGAVANDWRILSQASFSEMSEHSVLGERVHIIAEGINLLEAATTYQYNMTDGQILTMNSANN